MNENPENAGKYFWIIKGGVLFVVRTHPRTEFLHKKSVLKTDQAQEVRKLERYEINGPVRVKLHREARARGSISKRYVH